MKQKILVVGGAGYIGSHAVKMLAERGYEVTVLDNLSAGHAEAVPGGELIRGDLGDEELLEKIFSEKEFFGVMHFAALIFVGVSEKDPLSYYENNTIKTYRLLKKMMEHGIQRFIFSSTAAVYGEPESVPIKEDSYLNPINPYGNTKLAVERMLVDFAKAYDMKFACLRYFNAAGADPSGAIGEAHDPENHLIPLVLDAASGKRDKISVYGTDYDTPDGTCIRDYIHVLDLVDAHIMAIEKLDELKTLRLNLGSQQGFSVREIINLTKEVTGKDFTVAEEQRRPGDPPRLVADSAKARELLGWKPCYDDVGEIIRTAWNWHQNRKF